MEPYKKRRWRKRSSQESITFFTCARPGRSVDKTKPVPDKIVHQWVNNLPGPPMAIISLLGRKPSPRGTSEFSFYTFHGRGDTVHERRGKPSWQEWLDHYHPERGIEVIEHPTVDFQPIPETVLAAIAADVDRLLAEGRTVVLVDSGGETRTGAVCRYLNLVEELRTCPGNLTSDADTAYR